MSPARPAAPAVVSVFIGMSVHRLAPALVPPPSGVSAADLLDQSAAPIADQAGVPIEDQTGS